jgi:DNA-damage-inducible protein J
LFLTEGLGDEFFFGKKLLYSRFYVFLQSKSYTNLYKMSTATLQIRVENNLKEQAMALFDRLGLDLPTAIRIFLKKSVSENGVPFEIKEKPRVSASGLNALYALNDEAVKNGKAGMTEEEIEAEIASAHAKNN